MMTITSTLLVIFNYTKKKQEINESSFLYIFSWNISFIRLTLSWGVWYIRMLGKGGMGKFTHPLNISYIFLNFTKLGSLFENRSRSRKLCTSFSFLWRRHHILLITSSKISVFKGRQDTKCNFLNFDDPSDESLRDP